MLTLPRGFVKTLGNFKHSYRKYQKKQRRFEHRGPRHGDESKIEFGLPGDEKKKPVAFRPWSALVAFSIVGGGFWYLTYKKRKDMERVRATKSAGKAHIGGNFSLVDHYGRPITSANLFGTYTLVYFGFTYCPDICPIELSKMKKVIDALDESVGEIVQPVLITVDPWRDSVEQMATYVKEFHPRLFGLTGTPQQIEDVSKKFRVYISKGPEDESEDYLVDHSIFMYLMDKEFNFIDFFGVEAEEDEIIERIRNHLVEAGDAEPPGVVEKSQGWFKKMLKD